jgi:PAS domain S-box-containing protein
MLLFAGVAANDRAETLRLAEADLLATLDTLHGQAERVFQFQALALAAVDERLRDLTEDQIRGDLSHQHRFLAALRERTGGVLGTVVFDRHGHPVVDSDRPQPPTDVDVSDRPYFRWHRENATTEPLVSLPFRSRASGGAPTFFVTVRRSSPLGPDDFAGVIAAGVRVATFAEFWARAVPDPNSTVILFREDGTILARRTPLPEDGVVLPGDAPIRQAAAAGPRTVVTGVSPIDGTERLLAARRLEGFPVYVGLGVATATALAPWRARMALYGAFATAASLLLAVMALLVRRRTARLVGEVTERASAEAEVRSLNAELERRVAERTARLEASEARLRLALRAAEAGVWEWDVTANRTTWSDEYYELLGMEPGAVEAGTDAWLASVHPDDRDRAWQELSRTVAEKQTDFAIEFRVTHPIRGVRWLLGTGRAEYAPDGSPLRVAGLNIDITRRREAEEALRAAEARFRALFEAAPVAAYVTDGEALRIVDCNDAAALMLGYSRDQLRSMSLREVDAGQDEVGMRQRSAAMGDERVSRFETRHRTRSGELRDVYISTVPVVIDGERLFYSVVADVTEQRRAEAALVESEARFRATFEEAPVGIANVGLDGSWRRVNRRLPELLGYTEAELTARTFGDVTHPGDLAADLENVRRLLAGEISAYSMEKRYFRKDGSTLWADLTVSLIREEGGAPREFISIIADISARKAAEAAVRDLTATLEARVEERTKQLSEVIAELDAFAYSISHDLRAPLRGMEGFARILLEDYGEALGPDGGRYAERIVAAATRMEGLIQDILAYSRLSRDAVELVPVDLGQMVDRAVAELREGGAPGGAEAEVAVEHPLPQVLGSRPVVGQILVNLLSNAAKFTAPGDRPRIRVRAEPRGDRLRLWVEDNGIGLAGEHLSRIFNVFERLHGGEAYPGTGIGLAIVRKGAERLGGAAGVESEGLGRGSRFWVEFRPAAAGGAGGEN